MTVAELLAKEIEKRGWTQAEAAAEVGFHRVNLNMVLNGRLRLRPHRAMALERVFDIPAERWLTLQAEEDVRLMREKAGRPRRRARVG